MLRLIKRGLDEDGMPVLGDALDNGALADADAYVRVLLPHLS
jgi:hypothetical protein